MCLSLDWTIYVQFGGVSYVYQLYFRVANLLDDSDFISSSFFYGSGPGRSKSMYEIILSLVWSFNGRRCGDNLFIISRNDKYLKNSPTTFNSYFVSIYLSSFKSMSFFGTFTRLLSFFAYRFCFSSTLLISYSFFESFRSHYYIDLQYLCHVPAMD